MTKMYIELAPSASEGGKEMNYDNMTAAVPCNGTCVKLEEVPLAQTLKEATEMANNVLNMAHTIDQHLFGRVKINDEIESPSCFREALVQHRNLIQSIGDEMRTICNSLGV